MMSTICFEKYRIPTGTIGPESVAPDVFVLANIQNKTRFALDEYDEIYEAYGQRPNGYPYRQQNDYNRVLTVQEHDAVILENDLAVAVFLPGFGGRLWKLYDKVHQKDLLYTNDCLRASNLAVRNAWFSGGAEWNIGVIGHTPFTMDRIFASHFKKGGTDILRMYAYERIRGVVYQMDFWLDDSVPALNCHMAVNNATGQVVPMYWWSNIASPLYPEGRLLVPAHKAYSYDSGVIVKVDIPHPCRGIDVSRPETVPISKDYFFSLDEGKPRWIANMDHEGNGLLHTSTQRLQSRKLFTWGQSDGARHWQEFLTEKAGDYLEIQAGLGKTQYGCIPMAPHTTWEWTERYEGIQLTGEQMEMSFDDATESVSNWLNRRDVMETADLFGHENLREDSLLVYCGTGDAALQNALREKLGKTPLRTYLDFTSDDSRQHAWQEFLKTGILPEPAEGTFPDYDPTGADWLDLLKQSVRRKEGRNWYAYYCISMLEREAGRMDLARKAIRQSLKLRETAVGFYVAAIYEQELGQKKKACRSLCSGLNLGRNSLSYVKAAFQLLEQCESWQEILEQRAMLPDEMQNNPRISLYYAEALTRTGRMQEAMELLERGDGLQLDDIREGEISMGQLWSELNLALTGTERKVPHKFNFESLTVEQEKS